MREEDNRIISIEIMRANESSSDSWVDHNVSDLCRIYEPIVSVISYLRTIFECVSDKKLTVNCEQGAKVLIESNY